MNIIDDNPLLNAPGLPAFSLIRPEHAEPAIDAILAYNRARIEALLAAPDPHSWDSLIRPLHDLNDRLDRAWAPVSHLNNVANSKELRGAYNACLPKLSRYTTELGQHVGLYRAYRAIAADAESGGLDSAQRKALADALRDFRLSGIELDSAGRARYEELMQELTSLASRFEENLLDSTQAWRRRVAHEKELAGLPPSAIAQARQAAEQAGSDGWLLTLDFPCYHAVLTFADDPLLREALYAAYVTRASDEGPHAGRWDNGPMMERILAARHEVARLLGFASYAERSLATKMAASPQQVMDFLGELAERALPVARREYEEIESFAREHHGASRLAAWDVAYYAEKLRRHRFEISQEDLRPYFPLPRVLSGLFAVVERLYGVRAVAQNGIDVWHPDVRYYGLQEPDGTPRGGFYLDLYARAGKRGGAWMDECVGRRATGAGVQLPVAFVNCNFAAPVGDEPALLSHDEVLTLFHEFGHALHHLLTRVDYPPVAGIRGVPWDAVELPSQLMENWCWDADALALISGHHRSGEPLPADLLARLKAARNFQSGLHMVRQLEFALFDFRLHHEYEPAKGARIQELLDEVRRQVAVIEPPPYNRFAHSFAHIFAGGYAAGYYSYKWAEVLSSDAFSAFEEQGIFDAETGRRFMQTILEQGGARDPLELFVAFRGREPQIDALLRHSGLI